MSVQVRPVEQLEFRGIYTAGNPIQRPRGTARRCANFRVMPGGWLRLRSGLQPRVYVGQKVQQIAPIRMLDWHGSEYQLVQVNNGGVVKWHWWSALTYVIADGFTDVETIATASDYEFAKTNPAPMTNLIDRPVMYNGLGVRDASSSRPPFSHYTALGARYFGLDAYCPAGNPTVSWSPGTGYNKVLTRIKVYVGLYHEATAHYSNGVLAGTIGKQDGLGAIMVSNLNRLKYATHGPGETAELYYVFYATNDGGEVPYLILNSTLDGPYKVPVTLGGTAASLSIDTTAEGGFVRNLAAEMPIENFPPRPMRSIAYVNGRLYGAPMLGGTSGGTGFNYRPDGRELASVCWSAAAGDSVETAFLGDPLQSWPLLNMAYTPNGEQPCVVAAADDGVRVLVITPTSCFYLEEQADGIHEWITLSRVHGITNPTTLRTTKYGQVWVNQRNQIVLLAPDARDVQILSTHYQDVLSGETVTCADYILDPLNQVDRYQVWFSGGGSVCHDFALDGEAYTTTGPEITAAATLVDLRGYRHHVVANTGVYTHEGQPETGKVPAVDKLYDENGEIVEHEIEGYYERNWDDFADSDLRKEMPMVDLIGDGAATVEWYGDLEEVKEDNKKTVSGEQIKQSDTAQVYRYKLANAHKFWYKLAFRLTGHSEDCEGYYPNPADEGDLPNNFYGSILRALWRLGIGKNRA